jgi:6-phosphofructokinase 1
MNAAIRAVVRVGAAHRFDVFGVRHGYAGLIAGEFIPLGVRDVGGVIERGGTMLGTTRCPEFLGGTAQDEAIRQLRSRRIDGLVVIGGNGSQAGAHALSVKGVAVAGVASTIDNDLCGSDLSIGTTTACDVALESIDRLRVTASSHGRVFLVEVMGRECGHLAMAVGIASGAEVIVVPEVPSEPEDIAREIAATYERGKSHAIVVVAEGARVNADALADYFRGSQAHLGFDLRVCRLGHVQRGGAPGVTDRMLATRLGAAAVEQLAGGRAGVLLGVVDGKVVATPLPQAHRRKPLDTGLPELARALAQ